MTMSDPLADMLTRIRNGQHAGKDSITVLYSKVNANVLDVLQREGYIRAHNVNEVRTGIKNITVELKYYEGSPVIKTLERVSRPGRRSYKSIDVMPKYYNGLGVYILSTSKGIVTDHEARLLNVGGEVIGRVY